MDIRAEGVVVTFVSEVEDIVFYNALCDCDAHGDGPGDRECRFTRFKAHRGDEWETLHYHQWMVEYGPDYVLTELIGPRGATLELEEPFELDYPKWPDVDTGPVTRGELGHVLEGLFGSLGGLGKFLQDKSGLVDRVLNRVMWDGTMLDYDKLRDRLHESSTEVYDVLLGDGRINPRSVINLVDVDYGASKRVRPEEWWLEQEGPVSYSTRGSVVGALVLALISSPLWFGPVLFILAALLNPTSESVLGALCFLPVIIGSWFIILGGVVAGQLLRRTLTIDYEKGVVTLSEDLFGIGFYDHSESIELSRVKCVRVYEAGDAAPGADRVKICTHEYSGNPSIRRQDGLVPMGDLDATMLFASGKFDSMELAEMLGVKWKPRPLLGRGLPIHPEW